jgi:hypothetical protein
MRCPSTGPPGTLYANRVALAEVGPEGNNVGIYTPLAGQPGFVPGAAQTYIFVSDGTVPEPSAVVLVLLGTVFVLLGVVFPRREIGHPILGGRITRA